MDKLNILWTTTNKGTISHMIAMYAVNALKKGLWKEMNVIVWGASAKLIGKDAEVQGIVKKLLDAGVTIEGCLACAEEFEVVDTLNNLGIDLKYMGVPLTGYLKGDEKILTI